MATLIKFSDGTEKTYGNGVRLLGCTWSSDLGYRDPRQYGLRSYVAPSAVVDQYANVVMPNEVTLLRVTSVEEVATAPHPESVVA